MCSATNVPLCADHIRIGVVRPDIRQALPPALPALIREATRADRDEIASILMRFWGKTDGMRTYGKSFDMLQAPALVAVGDQNRLVGVAVWTTSGNRALLIELSVLPACQSAGLGRLLIQRLAEVARDQGLTALALSTTNDNLLALAFYQRLGFVIEGVKIGLVAREHEAAGEDNAGHMSIPARDEFRLVYNLR